MMRLILSLLLIAVPVLGVYTYKVAPEWGIWFPANVSTFGDKIDGLYYLIQWMVGIVFVLTEGALFWFVFRYSRRDASKATFTHGNHTLEMVWTAIPAVLLLVIAFAQMGTWADIKFASGIEKNTASGPYSIEKPTAEVVAYQFAWLFRYPDEHGDFDGPGAFEQQYDLVVPEDTPVVLHLKSRDVLHSFFVPQFRLKQDAVPGMTIPIWFDCKKGHYELICAELCGWGHYKMAGRVRVLPQAEYETWLAGARAEFMSNGQEDAQ